MKCVLQNPSIVKRESTKQSSQAKQHNVLYTLCAEQANFLHNNSDF